MDENENNDREINIFNFLMVMFFIAFVFVAGAMLVAAGMVAIIPIGIAFAIYGIFVKK